MVTIIQANNARQHVHASWSLLGLSYSDQTAREIPRALRLVVREAWVKLVTGELISRTWAERRVSNCWKFGPDLQTAWHALFRCCIYVAVAVAAIAVCAAPFLVG